jgi:hypothetical protein
MNDCLHLHLPRTGGVSVRNTCLTVAENPICEKLDPHAFTTRHDYASFPHWPIPDLLRMGAITRRELKRRFVFSVVRNPWDRLVSIWHLARKNPRLRIQEPGSIGTFTELAVRVCSGNFPRLCACSFDGLSLARPQADWLSGVDVDYLGRFEDLTTTWRDLCSHLGIKAKLSHDNGTIHADYRTYYSDKLAEKVGLFYLDDVENYGYTFGGGPS